LGNKEKGNQKEIRSGISESTSAIRGNNCGVRTGNGWGKGLLVSGNLRGRKLQARYLEANPLTERGSGDQEMEGEGRKKWLTGSFENLSSGEKGVWFL